MDAIAMMVGSDADSSPEVITVMLVDISSSKAVPLKLQVQSLEQNLDGQIGTTL
jgi:hypothetical protein